MTDAAVEQTESPHELVEWTITYQGHSFTLDDLTGDHLVNLSVLLGDSWQAMTPLTGPFSLMAFIAVFVASQTGAELTDVFEELKLLKAQELLNLISITPAS